MVLYRRGADSGSMDSDASAPDDDEERTVRPEDLDISGDRRVVELDDRRYVVATANSEAPSLPPEDDEPTDATAASDVGADDDSNGSADAPSDRATAREALIEYVGGRDARHGFVVVGSFDDEVDGAEAFDDDLPAVFGEFVTWYAKNVDAETPSAEVLGILLAAAGIPVQHPVRALEEFLSAHDLSADDPIDDLLEVAREEGVRLPPPTDE